MRDFDHRSDFDPTHFFADDPNIQWDLDRLGTSPPTPGPTTEDPTPAPSSPEPTTEDPTPAPSLEPTTPEPTPVPTPDPVTPSPVTPSQEVATPIPTEPFIATLPLPPATIEIAPAPVATTFSTSVPTTYAPTTGGEEEVRTTRYFSCPAPSPRTISATDKDGNDVVIEIPPPVSTVKVGYDFQVQLLEEVEIEDDDDDETETTGHRLEDMMEKIQNRLGETLGGYMTRNSRNNNNNGDRMGRTNDPKTCEGYYVEDFRRRTTRRLDYTGRAIDDRMTTRSAATAGEDVPTRIIGISSAGELEVDEDRTCIPKNDGCYLVHGELDATYVGFNEAGVKSSVARAIKEEMMVDDGGNGSGDDDYEYSLQFLGAQTDGEAGLAQTTDSNVFSKVIGSWADVVPQTDGGLTPVGVTILGVLGLTFIVLFYALFKESDAPESIKDEMDKRKEKKDSKKKALSEDDDERQSEDDGYCYDLESVAIDYGAAGEGEEGLEIRSVRSPSLGKSASVLSGSGSSRDSGRTRRVSNKENALNYGRAQRLGSLLEMTDESSVSYSPGASSSSSGSGGAHSSGLAVRPRAVNPADAGCSVKSSDYDDHGRGSTRDRVASGKNPRSSTRDAPSPPVVDRTPSFVTSTSSSPRASPKAEVSPTSVNGSAIHQLPSISEAELPPPMNDTPHVVKHHRARTDQWEV